MQTHIKQRILSLLAPLSVSLSKAGWQKFEHNEDIIWEKSFPFKLKKRLSRRTLVFTKVVVQINPNNPYSCIRVNYRFMFKKEDDVDEYWRVNRFYLNDVFSYIHPKDLNFIFKTLVGSLPRLLEEIKRQATAMDVSKMDKCTDEVFCFYVDLERIIRNVLWGFIRELPTPFKSRKREGPLGLI